jgi:hypothetical protein
MKVSIPNEIISSTKYRHEGFGRRLYGIVKPGLIHLCPLAIHPKLCDMSGGVSRED